MPPSPVEPSLPTQQRPQRPARASRAKALGGRMPWWRRTLRKLQGLPVDSTSHTMLPVLMEVFAGFSKIDGSVMEE